MDVYHLFFPADPYSRITPVTNPGRIVSDEFVSYESGAEELHTDFAFRWSHTVGVSDIGLSFFQGTNREPVFSNINEDGDTNATSDLDLYQALEYISPHYEQMTQVGIDYQATVDAWLLKFEGIHRDSDSLKTPIQDGVDGKTSDFTTDYTAITAGFEYTFNGVYESPSDIGADCGIPLGQQRL